MTLDPTREARVQAALERAWLRVRAKGLALSSDEKAHQRLAVIIAELSATLNNEDELVGQAVQRFVRE